MARVNLRNRLRENSGDEPEQSNVSGFNSTQPDTTPEISENIEDISISQADISQVNIPLKQHAKTYPSESPPANNNFETNDSFKTPKQQINARLNSRPVNKQPLQETYSSSEDILFKDENEAEDSKIKTLFGTRKLFNKKEEKGAKSSKGQGILDKLNINKKMFYFALGLAVVASILVINYLNSFKIENLYGSEPINILIANKEIKEKSVITLADLAQKQIPKKFVLPTSVILDGKLDPKSFVGKIALTDIFEGEQISARRVVTQEDSPWLSPAVPLNHRAFSISTRSLSYIKPTDHVDVLISVPDPLDKGRIINNPVLQNGLVLAVDGKYKISNNDTMVIGESVTIAVPNNLVGFFSLIQDKGNFQLALRRQGDTTNLSTKYTISQLEIMLNGSDTLRTVEKPKPAPIKVYTPPPVIIREVATPVYRQPVYRQPVYTPPRRVTPKPAVKKPVAVSKPVSKPYTPAAPTTVTVINGTNVSQHSVNKDQKKPQ